jgi:hypothetical protein
VIPFLIGFGVFEYVNATGFKKLLSSDSLNSKVTLLISSKGSLISSAQIKEILSNETNMMRNIG